MNNKKETEQTNMVLGYMSRIQIYQGYMKCPEQENREKADWWLPGVGGGVMGMTANSYGVSFWADVYIMQLGTGDSCTIL